jgi:putative Holliday junction resolvase
MRVLGIDYGDRNIGLAISDTLHLTAHALGSYRVKSRKEDEKFFLDLVSKHNISEIVIGFPLRMNGTSGTRVEKTKEFAAWLKKALKLPIFFWDERLTTQQALKILSQQKIHHKRKKVLKDQISAILILSSYLESKRNQNNDPQSH